MSTNTKEFSPQLSPWAANISPSPTLAVDSKAKALKAAGEDVCGFGSGEPDFDTPEFIKEACAKALADGKTKYCPAPGLPALRKAVAEKYARDNNVTIEPTQVVVSPGGKYSCMLAIQAVIGAGDEVLIPAPYWVSYPEMVKLAGGTPVVITADDSTDFKVTPEQVKEAITPKTKLFILNSPSNPTGSIYSPDEVRAIVDVCVSNGVYIMSDEIYEYLLYDGVEHLSPASISEDAYNYTITVAGFSKTFSMTGWRLGTLIAHPKIAKAVASIQSQTSSNATTFAQYGALAALEHDDKSKAAIAGMLKTFDARRLKMLDALNAIDGITCQRAKGAFYLFPNASSFGIPMDEFAGRLLDEHKVAIVPGAGFGAEGYFRMSYATDDRTIDEGLKRLKTFCDGLKPAGSTCGCC